MRDGPVDPRDCRGDNSSGAIWMNPVRCDRARPSASYLGQKHDFNCNDFMNTNSIVMIVLWAVDVYAADGRRYLTVRSDGLRIQGGGFFPFFGFSLGDRM